MEDKERGTVKGLLWFNEEGEREVPLHMIPGRSFYEGEEEGLPDSVREYLDLD